MANVLHLIVGLFVVENSAFMMATGNIIVCINFGSYIFVILESLHCLYDEMTFSDGNVVFYNKYNGL